MWDKPDLPLQIVTRLIFINQSFETNLLRRAVAYLFRPLHRTAVCNWATKEIEIRHHALHSPFVLKRRLEQVPVGSNNA